MLAAKAAPTPSPSPLGAGTVYTRSGLAPGASSEGEQAAVLCVTPW